MVCPVVDAAVAAGWTSEGTYWVVVADCCLNFGICVLFAGRGAGCESHGWGVRCVYGCDCCVVLSAVELLRSWRQGLLVLRSRPSPVAPVRGKVRGPNIRMNPRWSAPLLRWCVNLAAL